MRRPATRSIATLLALIVVAGCSGQPGGTAGASPSATPDRRSPDGSVLPSVPAGVDVPAEVLSALLADAAARTGADPATVAAVRGARVTWNDGSWGCPEPGVLYTQALVDGWQVIVEAGGQRIDYRAVAPDRFRVCKGLPGT